MEKATVAKPTAALQADEDLPAALEKVIRDLDEIIKIIGPDCPLN